MPSMLWPPARSNPLLTSTVWKASMPVVPAIVVFEKSELMHILFRGRAKDVAKSWRPLSLLKESM